MQPMQPRDWIRSGDTGTSSETIWSVMTGFPVARYGWPYDPADFGRCWRLLNRFPEWKDRLHEVAEAFPNTPWGPLIREWKALSDLYCGEVLLQTGRAPRTYELMQKLRREGGERI